MAAVASMSARHAAWSPFPAVDVISPDEVQVIKRAFDEADGIDSTLKLHMALKACGQTPSWSLTEDLLSYTSFIPQGDCLSLDQFFRIFVLLKKKQFEPVNPIQVGPPSSVAPDAVLPADILKNVCADFHINIDLDCLVKSRDSHGHGMVEYRDFAAFLVNRMHRQPSALPEANPDPPIDRPPSPPTYHPTTAAPPTGTSASYPKSPIRTRKPPDDPPAVLKKTKAIAKNGKTKGGKSEASAFISLANQHSDAMAAADCAKAAPKVPKKRPTERHSPVHRSNHVCQAAACSPETARPSSFDGGTESCSSTEETEGQDVPCPKADPIPTHPREISEHRLSPSGKAPSQSEAVVPKRVKTCSKARMCSPRILSAATEMTTADWDAASQVTTSPSAGPRIWHKPNSQWALVSPRKGKPGTSQRRIAARGNPRPLTAATTVWPVVRDCGAEAALFRPLDEHPVERQSEPHRSREGFSPPLRSASTVSQCSTVLEMTTSLDILEGDTAQASSRTACGSSPVVSSSTESPPQDTIPYPASPLDIASPLIRRLEPSNGQRHVRRVPHSVAWDPCPPPSRKGSCPSSPLRTYQPSNFAPLAGDLVTSAVQPEDVQRARTWAQRVQLIEDIQEEVQRTRERVKCVLARVAERENTFKGQIPSPSVPQPPPTSVVIRDHQLVSEAMSNLEATNMKPMACELVLEATSEAEGYEDDYEFEEEEPAASEPVPMSTRLVQAMIGWGIYDEPPSHIPAKPIIPVSSSAQQSRKALQAAEWYNKWNNYEFWHDSITIPHIIYGSTSVASSGAKSCARSSASGRTTGQPGAGQRHATRPPQRVTDLEVRSKRTSSAKPSGDSEGRVNGPCTTAMPTYNKRSASAVPNRVPSAPRPYVPA